MKNIRRIVRDEDGAAVIEMAFAFPIVIVMIYMIFQLAQAYRALAGIQQALGEGARYATLCVNPGLTGCGVPAPGSGTSPTAGTVKARIQSSVYGIGPGTFTVDDPRSGTSGTASYYDLTVCYTQPTSLLLVPGPTISVSRSKRVWVAATPATSGSTTSCAS
jgi:Flp pilus assembly protein TadG